MAKIAQVSAKYIIKANIKVDGIVDRPDVIGAVFGQTEGLLGADLELRELQKSGRIGRIEVQLHNKKGNTKGTIQIPSSLDKAETSIIAASIEIIERIGPCNADVTVESIEDVRITKRDQLVKRAKALLRDLIDNSMPDSQEMSDEVAHSVRMMEIETYGDEKLPCGPGVKEAEEVLIVEGRADVLQLLKHGFKNAIAVNGTKVPKSIKALSQEKIVTAFVDGDRGGDLIVKSLLDAAEIDHVTTAPDGKEVEDLTKKEIHKALRSKVTAEQAGLDLDKKGGTANKESRGGKPSKPTEAQRTKYVQAAKDVEGNKAATIFDAELHVLGKVPVMEVSSTVKSLGVDAAVHSVVIDGPATQEIVEACEAAGVAHLVGTSEADAQSSSVNVYKASEL